MQKHEFKDSMEKLKGIYSREMNNVVKDELWSIAKFWPTNVWFMVVRRIIDTRDRVPTIATFMTMLGEIRELTNVRGTAMMQAHVPCSSCQELGLRNVVLKRKDGSKYMAVARCDCRNAENWDEIIGNFHTIPKHRLDRALTPMDKTVEVQAELSGHVAGTRERAIVDALKDCETLGEWAKAGMKILHCRFPSERNPEKPAMASTVRIDPAEESEEFGE